MKRMVGGFVLNPVWLVFLIYIISNGFYFFVGIEQSGFSLLDEDFLVEPEAYFVAYLVILAYAVIIFFSYLFLSSRYSQPANYSLSNAKSVFFSGYYVIYTVFVLLTGADVVGGERDLSFPGLMYLNYLFKIINPDLLLVFIMPLVASSRIFFAALVVFVISMTLRGWMGGIYIAGLVYLVRFYPVRMSFAKILLLVLFCLCLPFLNSLKWGIRGGYEISEILMLALEGYSFDSIVFALGEVFKRFQHVNNVALIYQNSGFVEGGYFQGGFRSFYSNGFFYDIYCAVTSDCRLDLNAFLVDSFYEPGEGRKWNVDPGISGWFFINPIISLATLMFFLFFCVVFPFLFSQRFGVKVYQTLVVCSFIYFFHGWFGTYINLLFVALLVLFCSKLRLCLRVS